MGQEAYWLNRRRLVACARILVAFNVAALLYWLAADVWLAEAPVAKLRNDFAGFWSIGHMVLNGRAGEAYFPDVALAVQAAYVPEHEVRLPWFYPPQMFFLFAPLASLPYLTAFFLRSGGCLVGLAW